MRKTMAALIMAFILLSASVAAADWDRTYGGKASDYADSLQCTSDGGYIFAGGTYSFSLFGGGGDAVILKTDSEGNVEWYRIYGKPNEDWFHSVWQTSDEAYVLAGYTHSYGAAGASDVWLVRTDGNGDILWSKTFGGTEVDRAFGVQQTADGGYIIAGDTSSYGAGSADIWLIKTDTDGNEEWNRTFGGEAEDGSYCVQQTADGGYIIAGHTFSFSGAPEYCDGWVIKTDAEGIEEWSRTFGGTKGDWFSSVQQTSDGGYMIGGYTGSYGGGQGDIWLIRLDADGNDLWRKTFGGPEEERTYSVRQTSDGGYVIAGYTMSYGAGEYDIWLIKTDPDGKKEWEQLFGGSKKDKCKAVRETSDGAYVLAGNTMSYGLGEFDIWLIKTSPTTQLRRIELASPETESSFSSPPTFSWISDGGENSAYAVDLSYSSKFKSFWSTYTGLHVTIQDTQWTMPETVWNAISAGERVYWRVRGADLNREPLQPIFSEEAWVFYKE